MVLAISSAATAIAAISALFLYRGQIKAHNRETNLAALSELFRILQADDIRMARRMTASLHHRNVPFKQWSDTEILEVERVCHTYNTVALMAKEGYFPVERLMPWRDSIELMFDTAEPLIKQYRIDRGSDFWEAFEWLRGEMRKMRS